MGTLTTRRSRAIKAFLAYIGALAVFGLLMASDIWWLDAAYIGITFAILLVFSGRVLISRWRSSDKHDVTKYGPGAALPSRWRRWIADDEPQ